ncbi:hypothetical protein ACET3Z_016426 [Daucus carota]
MAGFRLGFFIALLALAMLAESNSPALREFQLNVAGNSSDGEAGHLVGRVGDYIDSMEEMMMESESARRNLAASAHISYSALIANRIPCSNRGNSYYNCGATGRANPYLRGCTTATRCARR